MPLSNEKYGRSFPMTEGSGFPFLCPIFPGIAKQMSGHTTPEGRDCVEPMLYRAVFQNTAGTRSCRIGKSPFSNQPCSALAVPSNLCAPLHHAPAGNLGRWDKQRHALHPRQLSSSGKPSHTAFCGNCAPSKTGMAGNDDAAGGKVNLTPTCTNPPGTCPGGLLIHLIANREI